MSSTLGLVADIVPSSVVDGPGNRFVVFLQGCSFNCLACHNPHTIAKTPGPGTRWCDVGSIVDQVADVAPFLSGVTFSGGEATVQWPFVLQTCWALLDDPRTHHLGRLIDSNGDASHEVWQQLAPVIDGVMVDLKAFDRDVHHFLTGRTNDRVLASIRELDALDRLTEVRLLLVPGVNDTPDQLARTAEWLATLRTVPPVRLLAFRYDGTRPIARTFREATADDLQQAIGVLGDGGVRAIGNTGGPWAPHRKTPAATLAS